MVLLVAAVFSGSKVSHAQYVEQRGSVIGVNSGLSLINSLIGAFDYAEKEGFSTSGLPVLQVSYDRMLNNRFSIGAAVAYSTVTLEYRDPNVKEPIVDNEISHFEASFNRINLAVRSLFYYTSQDRMDIYSGLRVGFHGYSLKASSEDPDFSPEDVFRKRYLATKLKPGMQVILFGTNLYPVERLGINFEVSVGQPYFASMGLRYKI